MANQLAGMLIQLIPFKCCIFTEQAVDSRSAAVAFLDGLAPNGVMEEKELKDAWDRARRDIARICQENGRLMENLRHTEARAEQMQTELGQLKQMFPELESKLADVEKLAGQWKATADSLVAELVPLRHKLNTESADHAAAKQQIASLTQQLADQRTSLLAEYRGQLERLGEQTKQIQTQIEGKISEEREANKRCERALNETIDRMIGEKSALLGQIAAGALRDQGLTKKFDDLNAALTSKTKALAAAGREIASLKTTVEFLRNRAADFDKAKELIDKLSANSTKQQKTLDSMQQLLTHREQEMQQMAKALEERDKEIAARASRAANIEEQGLRATELANAVAAERHAMKEERTEMSARLAEYARKLEDKEREMKEVKAVAIECTNLAAANAEREKEAVDMLSQMSAVVQRLQIEKEEAKMSVIMEVRQAEAEGRDSGFLYQARASAVRTLIKKHLELEERVAELTHRLEEKAREEDKRKADEADRLDAAEQAAKKRGRDGKDESDDQRPPAKKLKKLKKDDEFDEKHNVPFVFRSRKEHKESLADAVAASRTKEVIVAYRPDKESEDRGVLFWLARVWLGPEGELRGNYYDLDLKTHLYKPSKNPVDRFIVKNNRCTFYGICSRWPYSTEDHKVLVASVNSLRG